MRGLPLALAGSTGGLGGLLCQFLKDASRSELLIPPSPVLSPEEDLHPCPWLVDLPSFALGLLCGFLLWPLFELLLLARLYLRRVLLRPPGTPTSGGLYRLLA